MTSGVMAQFPQSLPDSRRTDRRVSRSFVFFFSSALKTRKASGSFKAQPKKRPGGSDSRLLVRGPGRVLRTRRRSRKSSRSGRSARARSSHRFCWRHCRGQHKVFQPSQLSGRFKWLFCRSSATDEGGRGSWKLPDPSPLPPAQLSWGRGLIGCDPTTLCWEQ